MNLFDFAFFREWDATLQALSALAQPEDWDYHNTPGAKPLTVLNSYLHNTFSHLHAHGGVKESAEGATPGWAIFNTGLLTPNYEEIFAVFSLNTIPDRQKYVFRALLKESDREIAMYGGLPGQASYWKHPSDIVFDPDLPLYPNMDHIIEDNRERFPEPFRTQVSDHARCMALEGAIQFALRRVARDYRVARPQMHQGTIQFLLPLHLLDRTKADLALVAQRNGDTYQAITCLTLDMAYNNSRLLTRPSPDWLDR